MEFKRFDSVRVKFRTLQMVFPSEPINSVHELNKKKITYKVNIDS